MLKFYDWNVTTGSRKSVQYNAMNSLPTRIAIQAQFTMLLDGCEKFSLPAGNNGCLQTKLTGQQLRGMVNKKLLAFVLRLFIRKHNDYRYSKEVQVR